MATRAGSGSGTTTWCESAAEHIRSDHEITGDADGRWDRLREGLWEPFSDHEAGGRRDG